VTLTYEQAKDYCKANQVVVTRVKLGGVNYYRAARGQASCMEKTFEQAVESLSMILVQVRRDISKR
jgi:hypothetical protein